MRENGVWEYVCSDSGDWQFPHTSNSEQAKLVSNLNKIWSSFCELPNPESV